MRARETALNALIAVRRDGAWLNAVLKEYIRRDGLDSRDAALTARLAYGVIQNRLRLDLYLRQLLTGKLRDLHPVVRDILHLGLYQIYWMDRVPDNAAVNEAVELAKKYCKKQRFAPGLVNGVLRNAVRTKGQLKPPVSLEEKYSHPQALIELLRENIGEGRLEAVLRADNEAPATVVQVNTQKIPAPALTERLNAENVRVRPHEWMPDCLILENTGEIERLPSFREGLYYVQDAAARLSVLCAGLTGGENVLDCCAAPGGKSFAAAIAMGNRGSIASCDIHPHKLALIDAGAQRLGLSAVRTRLQDASAPVPAWFGAMDAVLADVPCSGYGIIRKKPDIRYKPPADAAELPELQLRILTNQARYVRPGGVLLYSTCTLLRAENDGVVETFLSKNDEFFPEPLPLPPALPQNGSGMLTLLPGEYDTDGFFICRLRRKS